MRRLLVPAVLLAVLTAGCASVTSTRSAARAAADLPAPVPATPQETSQQARDLVDPLLEAAADAVEIGAGDEFEDCEAAVFAALAEFSRHGADDPELAAYTADVFDELESLSAQLQPGPGELEPPPEPEPVAAERVAEAQARAQRETFDLPVVVNAEVTSLIDFYTGPYRDRFVEAMQRATKLLPFIREELKKAGLPADLAYLPYVESAFKTRARSRAKAQGLWQFMAGTARLYDLRSDTVVDERNDPYLATRAAIAHLADLHRMFGDWELALAAYNSGSGRVQRALRRGKGETDFWELRRHLPRETRNYVPALWAVLVVTKNPESYGFPRFEERPDCLARVAVEGALDLEVLAERGGFDVEQLAEINPALNRRITPMRGSYQLAVPCGSEQKAAATVAAIPEKERVRHVFHVVRKGDTLSAIARHYGTSIETISAANSIRNHRSLRIGQTLVIPRFPGDRRATRAARPQQDVTAKASSPKPSSQTAKNGRYVVRRGDTLFSIARRFGTTVAAIQEKNDIDGSKIHPGDVLLVR
ncbi:MAG: LysM peptidoglycan-binding domain-containing protein [Acidobacteria bacterium]|nr:LysM peptidoglycan-binding domain-containing protein [Acidobacteriota bacterium]